MALKKALDWFIDEIINPRIADAAKAAVTSVLATRPNQFVEFSRAAILVHMLGMKLALASGSGDACPVCPKQLIQTGFGAV